MKKLFSLTLILLLAIMLLSGTSAMAESTQELPYYVSDTAGLTSSDQWQKLESAAESVSERYGCGVYVVTLQDFRDYGSYSSIRSFSEDFYNRYRMGLGQNRNGILLVLSMAERDYCLIAYGSDAHYAFTDYGKEVTLALRIISAAVNSCLPAPRKETRWMCRWTAEAASPRSSALASSSGFLCW